MSLLALDDKHISIFEKKKILPIELLNYLQPLNFLKLKTMDTKGFNSIQNHHKWLFLIHLNTYVMGLQLFKYVYSFLTARGSTF